MTSQSRAVIGFLFRLLLAAGGELIISDLNPYRFVPQYWRPIRNYPDLIFDFPTIVIATDLNILESLLLSSMINYSSKSSMWLWKVDNDRSSGDGIPGSSLLHG